MMKFLHLLYTITFVLLLINTQLSYAYTDLRPILDAQKGQAIINIPKGTYEISTQSGPHYVFEGLKDVTINGNGSLIICKSISMAFKFQFCENVTLKDISIDYEPLCFTQGTITSVTPDSKTWTVRIHDGYESDFDKIDKAKLQLFDPVTRQVKKNLYTIQGSDYDFSQSATDPAVYNFTIKRSMVANSISVGEYVVMCKKIPAGMEAHTMFVYACKNFKAERVTIYGSNMFSIIEHDCDNSQYLNCIITRNLNDLTKSIPRLRSGNYDGIHSKHAVKGPTIHGCRVEFNGDDCIAVNGRFYLVYKVDQPNNDVYLLSKDHDYYRIFPNEKIVCVDNNGSIKANFTALNIESATATQTDITTCTSKFTALLSPTTYTVAAKIKIDNWPQSGINVGDYVYNENRIGAGFSIMNDTVGHTRARGILVKSSNGVIKNNLIEGTQLAGIVLAPEINWAEAGCSNNVEITGNTIKNCVFASTHPGMVQPAALCVISLNGANQISPNGAHNNLTIMNNVIDNCPRPGIVVTSTKGLNYFNNTFPNNTAVVRAHGSTFGVANNVDFWTKNVLNIDYSSVSETPQNSYVLKTSDGINIKELPYNSEWQMNFFDMNGRLISSQQVSNNMFISTKELKPGLFVALITDGRYKFVYKISN